MVVTTTAIGSSLSREAVEQLSARFDEPDWLLGRRLEAWRLFEEAPMPEPLSDDWKHTDASRLTLDGLLPYAPPKDTDKDSTGGRDEAMGRLIQRDSEVVGRSLDESLTRQGVILTDLHTAAKEHAEIVREHLHSVVTPAEWKYLSLHGALWSGGCLLYVPQDVEIELPIEYSVSLATPGLALFPHLLIVAEANSKVTVIQEEVSPAIDGLNVVSGAVEVIAKDGAEVRFVDVQRWGASVQNFSTIRASLGRSASFQPILLGFGAAITRTRLDVLLQEDGSRAELLGFFFGDADQQFDYHTLQDHIAPHTNSDLLFKSTLTDRSAMAWNGVVNVRETASQSSANQTSRNLLLSDKASASPTPILEILAHDVLRCSHGATVGPVDEEQTFYLQSRGIPHDEAERMLVEGFFSEVLERVPSEGLQRRVRAVLHSKLGW